MSLVLITEKACTASLLLHLFTKPLNHHAQSCKKVQSLNIAFPGVLDEVMEAELTIDLNHDRVIGIGGLSEQYQDLSVVEEIAFDSKSDLFDRGLRFGFFQSLNNDYIPIDIPNMNRKKIRVRLRNKQAVAREVQLFFIVE